MLQDSIRNNRLASSYLFTGPEGVGKNLVARTLAKALNCEKGDLDSCDECPSCLKMDKLNHPDLHLLPAASGENDAEADAIKIEAIRQLQREINLRPYEAKIKVFIINNAHQLTAEASNALLKILEEPPLHSLIILITSKPSLLFRTIISRCRVIKFAALPRAELKEILKKDHHLPDEEAHFLASFCEGRLGFGMKMKESAVFREKNTIIDSFSRHPDSNYDSALPQDRETIRKHLNILSIWLRDIYLVKTGIGGSEIINFDRRKELVKLAQDYSFADLDIAFKALSDSLLYLEQNINTRLLLSNLRLSLKG